MGKEVILRILFCLENFQIMTSGERKILLFFSSVNYHRIYSIRLKNSRFAEDVLFYPKNEVIAFPKIEIKWDQVWCGNWILTILSCENPSNIWESQFSNSNYSFRIQEQFLSMFL